MPTVYNKVTVNDTTYIDLSQDTVSSASHIRQGYTGHLNDGTQVTGTYAGTSPTLVTKSISANGTYNASSDNADGYSQVTVNVAGSSKNVQVAHGTKRVNASAYTDVGYEITVAKTGTYNVYWAGWRSSTSGTSGTQLYVNGTKSGNAITTFDGTWTNVQNGSRTSVSLTKNDKVTLSARSRNSSYYMYIFFLSIEEV